MTWLQQPIDQECGDQKGQGLDNIFISEVIMVQKFGEK